MFNNLKYRETVNEKRKEKRAIRRLMLREKKTSEASRLYPRKSSRRRIGRLEIGGENVSG